MLIEADGRVQKRPLAAHHDMGDPARGRRSRIASSQVYANRTTCAEPATVEDIDVALPRKRSERSGVHRGTVALDGQTAHGACRIAELNDTALVARPRLDVQ
ncbi:hypothetical protein [Variovorax sp. OV329]|uniref:hypothetical protein n=1 Tax=Variovorax sp. OV329 TaxID=1882825 RepID=UPI0020C90BD0|nr:hypothetical protein [Variovorax sp. OV329]